MCTPKSDTMHDIVFHQLDCTECGGCHKRPDLLWAWDEVGKVTITENATVAANAFTERAVVHLKATGWRTIGDAIYCSDCFAKNKETESGSQQPERPDSTPSNP